MSTKQKADRCEAPGPGRRLAGEVRQAQSVNGPLAVLNDYYDVYVTQPDDAKWRLDNMHEVYLG